MNCSTCENNSTCAAACDRLKSALAMPWSTGLRELAIGAAIDAVPTSQASAPVTAQLPELPGLRVIEDRIVRYFYQDGLSYKQIGKKLKKKKSFVKSSIRKARSKIGAFSANSRGSVDGQTDIYGDS